ncbi:hypothetical protein OsI_10558 [Oryza sativa Indica Group]|uniref:Uncharacterized protein n=1 Tax=Oryza sativa subsp. indica TaxID=39946 RepID=B8AQV3_ORYSI|nr:hypothetical protein OsI_10558 [Oryza sativa Indica Group]
MAMEICAEAFPLSRFPTLEKSYCADSRDTERSHNTNWITEVHFSNRGSNKLWISEVAKIKKRIRSLNLRKSLGQARFSSSTGCIHEQLLKFYSLNYIHAGLSAESKRDMSVITLQRIQMVFGLGRLELPNPMTNLACLPFRGKHKFRKCHSQRHDLWDKTVDLP